MNRNEWETEYRRARSERAAILAGASRIEPCIPSNAIQAALAARVGDRLRFTIRTRRGVDLWWIVGPQAIDGPRGRLP